MVECTALEMRHRCKPIGGSNPSLSASFFVSSPDTQVAPRTQDMSDNLVPNELLRLDLRGHVSPPTILNLDAEPNVE